MPKSLGARIRNVWSITWRVGLFFLVWMILAAPFFVPLGDMLSEWGRTAPMRAKLYAETAGIISMVAATWIMTHFVDRRPFVTIGFSPDRMWRDVGAGLAVGAGWLSATVAIAWIAGWISPVASPDISGPVFAGSALAVLMNVISQEILLCGFIFQTIRSRGGFTAALLVSAALFSGYHAAAFTGGALPPLNVFGAGLLFCLAYGLSGRLWMPIAIHFAWNLMLGPVLGLTVSGSDDFENGWRQLVVDGPALLTGGEFGLEGGLIATFTTAAVVAGLAYHRSRKRTVAAV